MPATTYNLLGNFMASAFGGNDPAKKNGAILEIDFSPFGGIASSIGPLAIPLTLEQLTVPERTVSHEFIRYLNGGVNHPTLIEEIPDIRAVFKDFNGSALQTRAVLEEWFRLATFDETSGFMQVPSIAKTTADLILISSDSQIRRIYKWVGLWPKTRPPIEVDMNSGEQRKIEIVLKADAIYPTFAAPTV